MRGLTSTLILLAVLAGLVGYIYFVDRDRPATTPRDQVFASVTSDDIEEVEIRSADGEISRLRRTDGDWTLVEPVEAEADRSEVSSITSSLGSLEIQRVVDENAEDLTQYGLDPGRIEVGFRQAGEPEFRRVLLGERTPAGGDLYARLPGENRVFLVPSYLDSTFNKGTFALRDKAILRFERDKVEGLELANGATAMQFARSGSEWRIVKPITARADYSAVESAVQRLASAQMHSIIDADGGELRKYGLERPTATMTVTLEGSQAATLTLGRTDNALVFAKDSARPMVFTVAPTLQTDVIKSVSDYRRKDLFDARAFTTSRIELQRAGETMTFEKTVTGDGEATWRDAAGVEVATEKIDDLLTTITSLRAQSFDAAAHPSLRTPEVRVDVRFADDGEETVAFARAGSEVVASRADEPGTARLDAASFDQALEALDGLR